VDDDPAALPLAAGSLPAGPITLRRREMLPRWFAVLQVLLVCGIPTGLVVGVFTFLAGVPLSEGGTSPFDTGAISLEFFAITALLDTALVALLIRVFLALSGETSRDVFLGPTPVRREVWRGLALLPVSFLGVVGVVYGLRVLAPFLHNVEHSPIERYLETPIGSAVFAVVAILAGGVREELQRGFILHRFEQRLGGAWVGLAAFSILFAVLHFDQGFDAAMAIGLLGVLWGVLYIKRRSAVASMVNHAGFNAAQVLQAILVRSF
jgi:membrane protease YdiL (CAAX protease family)